MSDEQHRGGVPEKGNEHEVVNEGEISETEVYDLHEWRRRRATLAGSPGQRGNRRHDGPLGRKPMGRNRDEALRRQRVMRPRIEGPHRGRHHGASARARGQKLRQVVHVSFRHRGRGRIPPKRGSFVPRFIGWATAGIIVLLAVVLAFGRSGGDAPPDLHIWIAANPDDGPAMFARTAAFEAEHDVRLRWSRGTTDRSRLLHALLAGPAPDVVLVDDDTGVLLQSMNVLLAWTADDYLLPVTFAPSEGPGDTPAALRIAVPRLTENPELARRFVAFLAEETKGGADPEITTDIP